MPFHTLVTQTASDNCYTYTVGQNYYISYNLAEQLDFTEPHCARLLWASGTIKASCLLFADFVKRTYVNGELEPFLGGTASEALVGWVPLASNKIQQIGYYYIRRSDSGKINDDKKFTIIVEIAPQAFIYGAQKST